MSKPKFTPEKRAELISKTRVMAEALLDDLEYIRELVLRSAIGPGEIRRLSATLRRILINRQLGFVAAPRIGRFSLRAINTKLIKGASEGSSSLVVFGDQVIIFDIEVFQFSVGVKYSEDMNKIGAPIFLSLDGFLNQDILCFQGQWIKRGQVLEHIANVAGGVHTNELQSPLDHLINRTRHSLFYRLTDPQPAMTFNFDAQHQAILPATIARDRIDVGLLSVLAAAQHLVESPDVSRLEEVIRADESG